MQVSGEQEDLKRQSVILAARKGWLGWPQPPHIQLMLGRGDGEPGALELQGVSAECMSLLPFQDSGG